MPKKIRLALSLGAWYTLLSRRKNSFHYHYQSRNLLALTRQSRMSRQLRTFTPCFACKDVQVSIPFYSMSPQKNEGVILFCDREKASGIFVYLCKKASSLDRGSGPGGAALHRAQSFPVELAGLHIFSKTPIPLCTPLRCSWLLCSVQFLAPGLKFQKMIASLINVLSFFVVSARFSQTPEAVHNLSVMLPVPVGELKSF